MKRFASYILYTLLLAATVCACSDNLDIVRDYGYTVETLPLPKTMNNGETINLEFSIIREGNWSGTQYKFRYFQSAGTGRLSYNGNMIPVNRFRDIASDDFVLTYQCLCNEQQQLDFVFENNFGRRVKYSINFGGNSVSGNNTNQ